MVWPLVGFPDLCSLTAKALETGLGEPMGFSDRPLDPETWELSTASGINWCRPVPRTREAPLAQGPAESDSQPRQLVAVEKSHTTERRQFLVVAEPPTKAVANRKNSSKALSAQGICGISRLRVWRDASLRCGGLHLAIQGGDASSSNRSRNPTETTSRSIRRNRSPKRGDIPSGVRFRRSDPVVSEKPPPTPPTRHANVKT